jgi:8-oxo-dGTP pyrophosphatase MutT (NUDIX family)
MKSLSCGILFKVKGKILLGHSTGNTHWDIPKGIKHEEELPIEAAIRETFEETGMSISKNMLKEVGKFNLTSHKNLHLYETDKVDIKLEELYCDSMVNLPNKAPFPELDNFKLFNKEEALERVYPSLRKVLKEIL